MSTRQKRLIRVETTVLMDFPEDWNDGNINFYLNDSSSCVSNVLSKLDPDTEGCACAFTKMSVLRAPSAEDIASGNFIDISDH